MERTARIAEWVNRARDLVNSPPNEATPERLAARAAEIASLIENVQADALGPDEIKAQGMGALAAVAQASHNEPRLVVLRYEPPQPAHKDLVLLALRAGPGRFRCVPAKQPTDQTSHSGIA